MLRGMVLENFVHFSERSALDFSKTNYGPNIFVGASSTGKTSVLELIRICMDIKLNSSFTTRFDERKTAYVFCEFEKASENYGPTVISDMIVDRVQEDNVDDDEEDGIEDTIFHKVLMYFSKEEIKFCSQTYFKTPDDRIVDLRKNVSLGKNLLDKILDKSLFIANKGRRPNENYKISSGRKFNFGIAFAEKVSNEIRKLQKENKTFNHVQMCGEN